MTDNTEREIKMFLVHKLNMANEGLQEGFQKRKNNQNPHDVMISKLWHVAITNQKHLF